MKCNNEDFIKSILAEEGEKIKKIAVVGNFHKLHLRAIEALSAKIIAKPQMYFEFRNGQKAGVFFKEFDQEKSQIELDKILSDLEETNGKATEISFDEFMDKPKFIKFEIRNKDILIEKEMAVERLTSNTSEHWRQSKKENKKKASIRNPDRIIPVESGKIVQERNSLCECGSGLKFKKCCLKNK